MFSGFSFKRKAPSSDIDSSVNHTFPGTSSDSQALRVKWRSLLEKLSRFEKISSGNVVTLLETGDEAVPAMLSAIRSAQTRVWLETYIFDSSVLARTFIDELKSAADRGCDVVVLVDYCGGLDFPFRAELEAHGKIDFVVFNSPFFSSDKCVGPISFRDHRKILIADSFGFVGSMNLHKETCGLYDGAPPSFYDVHVQLQGPAVHHLAQVFIDSLDSSESQISRLLPLSASQVPAVGGSTTEGGGVLVQILESNVKRERRSIQRALATVIKAADSSVHVASSYFMPPGFLKRSLLAAARRGVDVEMLLSGDSDFWPIPGDLLAQTHAIRRFVVAPNSSLGAAKEALVGSSDEEALKRARVYLYNKEHMHAKYTTVDGVYSVFGSFNFDRWSARRNLEVAVGVFDRDVAARVENIFKQRRAMAAEVTKDEWYLNNWGARAICAVAYFALKISGKNIVDGMDSYRRDWGRKKELMVKTMDEDLAIRIAFGSL